MQDMYNYLIFLIDLQLEIFNQSTLYFVSIIFNCNLLLICILSINLLSYLEYQFLIQAVKF